ncbi:MAG: malectin domain-containing carbohydrate-binding protein [Acidobacteriaceae bacterium]
MPKRTVRIDVRLSADEQQQVERSAKGQGYVNPSAFVRAAIRNEINGRDGEVTESEQRVTASLERLSQEIFRLHRGQQALFAVVDTIVKSFLTCVPEPPRGDPCGSVTTRGIPPQTAKAAGSHKARSMKPAWSLLFKSSAGAQSPTAHRSPMRTRRRAGLRYRHHPHRSIDPGARYRSAGHQRPSDAGRAQPVLPETALCIEGCIRESPQKQLVAFVIFWRDMNAHGEALVAPTIDVCQEELNRVLASRRFHSAPALSKILLYICNKHLDGTDDSSINEWNVALDALGRSSDFDPENDSIVRVEFHLLRKRLLDFYANEGAGHAVQITLPKSGYAPRFKLADPPKPSEQGVKRPPETSLGPETVSCDSKEVPQRRSWLSASVLVKILPVLLVLCAAGYLILGTTRRAHVRAGNDYSSPPVPAAGTNSQVRILVGFQSPKYIGSSGQVWTGDAYSTGGTVFYRPDRQIFGTLDEQIYQRGRDGNFRYDIPLKPGVYELHLHFAETFFGQTPLEGAEARRHFDVTMNGKPLLTGFDITDDAGGQNIPDVKVFDDVRPAADGMLHLGFHGFALLNAIEILADPTDEPLPVRIVCGMHPVSDKQGRIWQSDRYFLGGRESDHGTNFTGPDDASIYTSARFGNFSYSIPVAAGHEYKATLHFLDSSFNTPGERLFNVFCNGRTLLRNFDVVKESGGQDKMLPLSFDHLRLNAQGKLVFRFVPVRSYSVLRAIEVVPE